MSPPIYNPVHKAILDDLFLAIPGVEPGKMFGYPAYYVKGKLFACVYENGVGIRGPAAMAAELAGQPGITWFCTPRTQEDEGMDPDSLGQIRSTKKVVV